MIAKDAGVAYEPSALAMIACLAQGGMRDAISLWINALPWVQGKSPGM